MIYIIATDYVCIYVSIYICMYIYMHMCGGDYIYIIRKMKQKEKSNKKRNFSDDSIIQIARIPGKTKGET